MNDLDKILDKVSSIEFAERSIVANTNYKNTLDLRDVLYIRTLKKGYVQFVKCKYNLPVSTKVRGTLRHFEKLLKDQAPHFKKSHKSFIINTHEIVTVDKSTKGHYLASLTGLELEKDRVPITRHFAPKFAKLFNLTQLSYLEPINEHAEKIRSYGLKSFGREAIQNVDISSESEKKKFRLRYGIHNFNHNQLVKEFHERTHIDQIDKARVIRNTIYQIFEWLKWGILDKFDGSMRRLWYKYISPSVKKILPDKTNFIAEESDVYDYFNDFVELGFFKYKDFGFLDRYEFYREVGELNPNLLVFMEKTTIFGFPRRLARKHSTSLLVTSGQVPWITSEYMCDNLKKVIPNPKTPLTFFTLTDLNPGGFSIGNNLKKRFAFHGYKNIEVIQIITPDLYSDDLIAKNRIPLISWKEFKRGKKIIREPLTLRDRKLFPNYFTWFNGTKDWPGINDQRLIHRKKYKRYDKVTLYGMELDALELSDIAKNFESKIAPHKKQPQPHLNLATTQNQPDLTKTNHPKTPINPSTNNQPQSTTTSRTNTQAQNTLTKIQQILTTPTQTPHQKLTQIKALIPTE
ncbi:MAG: LytTR family transcriptional regulator [Flavobacteriaceae bacterium]|nr:LytTR family transcriptional regulator [Flavobacteriaceae bacterium]